ncbi:MAG TPA: type II secretion system F family protein, partial [Symbiobacteriaceae bacterium]|nr:type II secretion system F family protein [Symbiobacteriaceae bacterium]
ELEQAGLRIPGRFLLNTIGLAAALGVLLTLPFATKPLMLIGAAAFGLLPLQAVRARAKRRARLIHAAVEPALVQIARLCEVRRHPFLALIDALPLLQQPLKGEFEQAVSQCQAGMPLPEALRALAARCGSDFYLHQLAELVAINIKEGGDLSGGLERLATRLRTMEELRAEETAELFGYKWLTRILVAISILPLPYWALTRSASFQFYLTHPLAKVLLVWVALSGLIIASLPYWMAIED